jgi:hypothetical protein
MSKDELTGADIKVYLFIDPLLGNFIFWFNFFKNNIFRPLRLKLVYLL